ncbi:MAG: hypothetical protein KF740_13845 [Ramlibacter sp.]|nr:hypothetical protein [Ramlibacter sp.]
MAALGRLSEALTDLSTVCAGGDAELAPLTLATRGMIELRQGFHEEGKRSYEEALEVFERTKQDSQYTDCLAFYAREVVQVNTSGNEEIVQRALERYKKHYSPAAAVVLRTINQTAEVEKQEPLRKVVQWEWDKKSNTLEEKRGLTAKGASGFIVSDRDLRR